MSKFIPGDKVRVISDVSRHNPKFKAKIYTEVLGEVFTIVRYNPLFDTYTVKESIHNFVEWRLELVNSEINFIEDPEYESMLI